MFCKRALLVSFCVCVLGVLHLVAPVLAEAEKPIKFLRFRAGDTVSYGIVEGDRVRAITGDLFGVWAKSERTYSFKEIKILVPTKPSKVIALAGNYRDHVGDSPLPEYPQPFYKPPSTLQRHEGRIVLPKRLSRDETVAMLRRRAAQLETAAKSLRRQAEEFERLSEKEAREKTGAHYEAELVIVIGKRASNVSEDEALDYVLGITCGNDVSARIWQSCDVQWWRGKGSDTFGPCGPFIASGVDYQNLDMQLRVNGEVRQKTNTRYMIHNIAQTVSFISKHVTLEPGDLIFTGTTGTTKELYAGDVVEVEIEGVGVLRNTVVERE